ncbi:MAG: LOG family protein [Phycisphaerae bacterium]
MKKNIVTVFGSSQAEPLEKLYQTAFELGRAIAELGLTLCNGGYGGTMEASARGALEAGGHTIGVTCTRFSRSAANPYIRQEIPTFDLFQRLQTLIRLGRAYVVLPGGTGTLVELALVWELLNKGLLRGERPLIVLGNAWRPVIDHVRRAQPDAVGLHVVADVPAAREILSRVAAD